MARLIHLPDNTLLKSIQQIIPDGDGGVTPYPTPTPTPAPTPTPTPAPVAPTTPPGVPTGLYAEATKMSDGTPAIAVVFYPPSGGTQQGYNVYRGQVSATATSAQDMPYIGASKVGSISAPSGGVSYFDYPEPGVTWYYYVTAYNSAGEGAPAGPNDVQGVPPGAMIPVPPSSIPPPQPTIQYRPPSGADQTTPIYAGDVLMYTFSAEKSLGGNDLTGFQVSVSYVAADGTTHSIIDQFYPASGAYPGWDPSAPMVWQTSISFTAPEEGTYKIAADTIDTQGLDSGPASIVVQVLIRVAPDPAENLTALAGDTDIYVSWNAVADAASYVLYRNLSSDLSTALLLANPTGTSYTDTDVLAGHTYYYWLATRNEVGDSDAVGPASATMAQAPTPTPEPTPTPGFVPGDNIKRIVEIVRKRLDEIQKDKAAGKWPPWGWS